MERQHRREGVSKLSDATREALSDLPLAEARRMRNMLIHGYPEVDLDLVVQTVTNDLPTLIARLEALLGEPPQ